MQQVLEFENNSNLSPDTHCSISKIFARLYKKTNGKDGGWLTAAQEHMPFA